jgi:cysteine desulfurase
MEKLLVKEGAKIIGEYCNRLSNTSFISMPGVPSSHQIISFDMYNICVSSGSACSSGSISSVGILSTMNIKNNDYCRVSMSPNTTKNDLIFFINCWKKIYKSYLQKEN